MNIAGREAKRVWKEHRQQCNCDNKHGMCMMFTGLIEDAIQKAVERESGYIKAVLDSILLQGKK